MKLMKKTRLTRQRAIAKHCRECSGDSPKEVTLCSLLDCPLWEYRCGCHMSSKSYKARITKAFKKYETDVAELHSLGLGVGNFLVQG